jgi:putative drug exporter of the RND superfamily
MRTFADRLTGPATMAAMMLSQLTAPAQLGSTIAIGLLVDTLIVGSLLMPWIAMLLGRWLWWPQVVYPRGDHHLALAELAHPAATAIRSR